MIESLPNGRQHRNLKNVSSIQEQKDVPNHALSEIKQGKTLRLKDSGVKLLFI